MTGPTSPTNDGRRAGPRGRAGPRAGFTLLELSLTLAILGLIAALAFPRVMPMRSATDVRVRAYQITAVLRADRNAAIRAGQAVTTVIDAGAGTIRSGATGGLVAMPDDLALGLAGPLAEGIRFSADGRTSGGLVTLLRDGTGYAVRVDPTTAAVTIAEVRP